MSKYTEKLVTHWQDAGTFLIGAWLFFSPWILGFSGEQAIAWNAWITGLVIAAIAAGAFYAYQQWEEWLNAALGAWLIVSPWVLGFSATTTALYNAIIAGALVLALAFWAALTRHETGHKTA
ncbi:MAG: SPW repeat protein [Methyloligellaceae bacterium]